jgi:hypothetical protein
MALMTNFSCMECLVAEATVAIREHHLCEPCLRKQIDDVLLDKVIDGEMRVDDAGVFYPVDGAK